MEEAYNWYKEIQDKHPAFNPVTWIPLSVRYPDKTVKELWNLIDY